MAICAECTYLDIDYGERDRKFWCDKNAKDIMEQIPHVLHFVKRQEEINAL